MDKMNSHSKNEESSNQNHSSSIKNIDYSQICEENTENAETSASSTLEVKAEERISVIQNISRDEDVSSNHLKEQVEVANDSTLNDKELTEVQKVVGDKLEVNKQKTFKLPTDYEFEGPCSEHAIVGDDFSKKSEIHILCECEPNVAGAAVPTVQSFTPIENQSSALRCNSSRCNLSQCSFRQNNIYADKLTMPGVSTSNKQISNNSPNTEQILNDDMKGKTGPIIKSHILKSSEHIAQCWKHASLEAKSCYKKPSLIPKLARPVNSHGSHGRNYENTKGESNKREYVGSSRIKLESQKCVPKSLPNNMKTKDVKATVLKSRKKPVNIVSENNLQNNTQSNDSTVSTKVTCLQERLKITAPILRKKIEFNKNNEHISSEKTSTHLAVEKRMNNDTLLTPRKTIDDLYKSISNLRDTALALSDSDTFNNETKKYIDKLFRNISEIKLVADNLCTQNESKATKDKSNVEHKKTPLEKGKFQKSSTSNSKENKIYIKFMPAKDRKAEYRNKKKDVSTEQSEEVELETDLSNKLTSNSISSDTCETDKTEKNRDENTIKKADSMDGVFIPSWEPPKNIEEEEETNGLDITITFPEFSQFYSDDKNSHLSVCLSDISAEALKKLKRCPKDFTLKMDFVEGKVLFQSGKSPANNFQIGPDLKFAEDTVDTKKSDVISIKPSTECSFGSQLIPVENPKEIKSFKSLKSTDSELFNVVSLPFLYNNPYLATSHKSCITFRNEQIMSMAIIAKHIFKSMPQIPSLTNIFEDKIMESPSKTDIPRVTTLDVTSSRITQRTRLQTSMEGNQTLMLGRVSKIQEKRRKIRQNQRKYTSTSSVL